MTESVGGFRIDPIGASGSTISGRSEFPTIARFAINFSVGSIVTSRVFQLFFAGFTRGAFLVITFPFGTHGFRAKDGAGTTRTIVFRIFALEGRRIQKFDVDVRRGTGLRPEFLAVTVFAINGAIRAVASHQTVQKSGAIHTTETIAMKPFTLENINWENVYILYK